MKKTYQGLKKAIVICVFAVISVVGVTTHVNAATASIYLSPASSSVNKGGSFSINMYINTPTAVDTVNTVFSYDSSKLQLTNYSLSGSAYSLFPGTYSGSSGSVRFVSNTLGSSRAGTQFIAKFSFKALVGSGSASVSTAGSGLAYSGGAVSATTSGANVNLKTPAPTPPKTDPPKTNPPKTKPTPTKPKPTTKKPTIKKPTATAAASIKVDSVKPQYTLTGFTIHTSTDARVYVSYSTDKVHFKNSSTTAISRSHALSLSQLLPSTTYYYKVVATDSKGKVTTSSLAKFTTKGLTVSITVLDKDRNPLRNQNVTIHSVEQSQKTDGNGVVTFKDVAIGEHHLSYVQDGKTYNSDVFELNSNIKQKAGAEASTTQNIAVVLPVGQVNQGWLPILYAGLIAAGALIILVFIVKKIRDGRNRYPAAEVAGSFGDRNPINYDETVVLPQETTVVDDPGVHAQSVDGILPPAEQDPYSQIPNTGEDSIAAIENTPESPMVSDDSINNSNEQHNEG